MESVKGARIMKRFEFFLIVLALAHVGTMAFYFGGVVADRGCKTRSNAQPINSDRPISDVL